MMKEVLFLIY